MDPNSASVALMAAGTLFGASNQLQLGQAQEKLAGMEANQLERNAGQNQAVAQRQALEERRKARLLQSRARAVAASSGAGATDPTVLNIIGNLEKEGEYNALTALYSGDVAAQNQREEANMRRKMGKVYGKSGQVNALSTILTGASSLYDKYG